MATYAVDVLFGLDMQVQQVIVGASNSKQAMTLALSCIEHDGLYDFLNVECVAGEPDEEDLTAFWDHHHNFIGPIDDIPF